MNTAAADSRSVSPSPKEHFSDTGQRFMAAHLGMWTFLLTEVLFFGGLFGAYAVYRWAYPEAFAEGSRHLDFWIGTINTAVLLTSSIFVAWGDLAIRSGRVRVLQWCIVSAWALGAVFVVLKGYEYHHKYVEGMIPGLRWDYDGPHAAQVELFVFIYFALTGLHAVHMLAGLGVLAWVWWSAGRGWITPEEPIRIEIAGLYWHFVDVVWVFLYPLLYLIA